MARAIKQGQHIFIAFQDGEAVLDSQLRPRMYKSREQFEKSFPVWRDGKAELVEYAPTLTPPNEPMTMEELRKMDGEPVYMTFPSDTGNQCGHWALVGTQRWGAVSLIYGCGWSSYESAVETLGEKFYRRPPEGEKEPDAKKEK